jgi:transcriptional regulator with XRE-family HTH domain
MNNKKDNNVEKNTHIGVEFPQLRGGIPFSERLSLVLKHYGFKRKVHLARELGVNDMVVTHLLTGRNKPSEETIQKFLNRFPDLNEQWLRIGKGEMISSFSKEPTGDRIKELRLSLNLSLEVFAERLECNLDTVIDCENKQSEVSLDLFRRIVKVFKVNTQWFLFGEGDMFNKIDSKDVVDRITANLLSYLKERDSVSMELTPLINSKLDIVMQQIRNLKTTE